MAAQRHIHITLTGPPVAEWVAEHVPAIGSNKVASMGPLIGHSAYEGRATWLIPFEDTDTPSWKLMATALRSFVEVVPDARTLLDKHYSGIQVKIIGGPR